MNFLYDSLTIFLADGSTGLSRVLNFGLLIKPLVFCEPNPKASMLFFDR